MNHTRRVSFSILARILPFFGNHTNSILFRYSRGKFSDTRTNSTFSDNRRDSFSILIPILPYLGTRPDLPFFGTHTNSTLFLYSLGQFFDTRTDSTFSRYSPGFYYFLVVIQIRPFSSIRRVNFQYSPGFYHFSVITQIRSFSGTRGDSFLILARILPFPVLVGTVF